MKSPKRPAVPDFLWETIAREVQELIDVKFKVGMAANAAAAEKHGFNYIVDIYTEWRGRSFYICSKYRNPRPDATEEYFVVRNTRMVCIGGDRFTLSYMRHTGRWSEVYHSLTASECLETIGSEELFWPLV